MGRISQIIRYILLNRFIADWCTDVNLLNLQNGVFSIKDRQLITDSSYYFRYMLPYKYIPLPANSCFATLCPNLSKWFHFVTYGEKELITYLFCYLRAILLRDISSQTFIELVGGGGTGKSTFINIASALCGLNNTATSSLNNIERNRFETASLVGKFLLVITDSAEYTGKKAILKALTGGDSIRYEQKGKDISDPYYPRLLVIIATNEVLSLGDHTTGLARRRIIIPFNRKYIGLPRHLLSVINDQFVGEFTSELSLVLSFNSF